MSLVGLASALIDGPYGKTQEMALTGVDENGSVIIERKAFQFWPESVTTNLSVNYADKAVVGGSHPLKQWVSTNGRMISFSLLIARDMKRKEDLPTLAFLVDPQSDDNMVFNYDIRQEVDRLQACCLPDYTEGGDGITVAKPPPIVYIEAPGMGWSLNPDDEDILVGVITSLNVTYKRVFTESGIPRMATVDLSIAEIVQYPGTGVRFTTAQDLRDRPWFSKADS